jgi:excisionase family DNA binding protein
MYSQVTDISVTFHMFWEITECNMDRGGWSQFMPEHTELTTKPATIMTVHEVAEYLRMSEAKVYRLVKQHAIPVARIGKTWRFRRDLLDDWLSDCTESSMKIVSK